VLCVDVGFAVAAGRAVLKARVWQWRSTGRLGPGWSWAGRRWLIVELWSRAGSMGGRRESQARLGDHAALDLLMIC